MVKPDHFHWQFPCSTSNVTAHIHCPKQHPSLNTLRLTTLKTLHAPFRRPVILLHLRQGLVKNLKPSLQFESVTVTVARRLQVHLVWKSLASPRPTRFPAPGLPHHLDLDLVDHHVQVLPSVLVGLMVVPVFNFGVFKPVKGWLLRSGWVSAHGAQSVTNIFFRVNSLRNMKKCVLAWTYEL